MTILAQRVVLKQDQSIPPTRLESIRRSTVSLQMPGPWVPVRPASFKAILTGSGMGRSLQVVASAPQIWARRPSSRRLRLAVLKPVPRTPPMHRESMPRPTVSLQMRGCLVRASWMHSKTSRDRRLPVEAASDLYALMVVRPAVLSNLAPLIRVASSAPASLRMDWFLMLRRWPEHPSRLAARTLSTAPASMHKLSAPLQMQRHWVQPRATRYKDTNISCLLNKIRPLEAPVVAISQIFRALLMRSMPPLALWLRTQLMVRRAQARKPRQGVLPTCRAFMLRREYVDGRPY